MDFVDTALEMKQGANTAGFGRKNTTLVLVATNAQLTKPMAAKLAEFGSVGMARAISPVWTTYDGDIVIGISAGDKKAEINVLGVAAAESVAESIVRAVKLARPLGGLPGLSR
jgi:L-aminopeptidase/D-esterase-like protein